MTRASSYFSVKQTAFHILIALGLAGAGALPASAQYQHPGMPGEPESPVPGTSAGRPRFAVDATLQLGDAGKPTVRLDYRLSRAELLFERTKPAGYHAAYEVRVIFYAARGGRQVTGDTYVRELRAASYTETRIRGEDILDHLDFQVAPGRYQIQVAVTDLVAERTSGTTILFEVPSGPTGLVWFSDISLGTIEPRASGSDTARPILRLNPSKRYGESIAFFAASCEIFDQRPAVEASVYRLSFSVLSDGGERIIEGDTTFVRHGSRTPFLIRPQVSGLGAGSYRFQIELTLPLPPGSGRAKPTAIRKDKAFDVDQSRMTLGFASPQSLDLIKYIATKPEIAEIEKLEGEDARKAYWETFWRRRDPNPDTPENEARDEFYQRVQYANQHFSKGAQGWKTAMGRTYIVHGRPDEVVRNPFNFDRPPEEIWYYYREHLTFVFVDKDGFGRYELVVPSRGDTQEP